MLDSGFMPLAEDLICLSKFVHVDFFAFSTTGPIYIIHHRHVIFILFISHLSPLMNLILDLY
jgi:hypothetical protein